TGPADYHHGSRRPHAAAQDRSNAVRRGDRSPQTVDSTRRALLAALGVRESETPSAARSQNEIVAAQRNRLFHSRQTRKERLEAVAVSGPLRIGSQTVARFDRSSANSGGSQCVRERPSAGCLRTVGGPFAPFSRLWRTMGAFMARSRSLRRFRRLRFRSASVEHLALARLGYPRAESESSLRPVHD